MQSTTPFRPFFRTGGYGRRHGFTDSKRKLALPCPAGRRHPVALAATRTTCSATATARTAPMDQRRIVPSASISYSNGCSGFSRRSSRQASACSPTCTSPRAFRSRKAFALAEKTTVYYSDGTTEIGSYAEQNREIIDCSVLPDYVGNAIVSSEDRSFYTNKGIDLVGIARALYNNLTTGSRQGGLNHHPASTRSATIWARPHRIPASSEKRSWPSRSRNSKIKARCCATT